MASRPLHLRRQVRPFGRGPIYVLASEAPAPSASLGDEVRLFAGWFVGGFVFMTVYLF